ncbi:hypothetical protein [Streptomyces sp. A1499]|uniref:terpene synthase family protein n=1 Tax=Streptomyces sp. A1499 TaxID=2563104 RepID=UPI00109E7794|nr:hypothetical protein [Streptomyces sp. A1499]THC47412.1 hypothetical protein E7X58_28340 [Streptomyces sp. A1499]
MTPAFRLAHSGLQKAPIFPDGATYQRQALPTTPSVLCNPNYPMVYEQNARWNHDRLPFPDGDAFLAFQDGRHALWCAVVYPEADEEALRNIADYTALLFYVDDMGTFGEDSHRDFLGDLQSDSAPKNPVVKALREVESRFQRRIKQGTYGRFRKAADECHPSVQEENSFRDEERILTFEDYLRVRRSTIGIFQYVILIEYCLDLDLEPLLEQDSQLDELSSQAVEHCLYVNDLGSFRKERYQNDDMNAVAVLMRSEGMSLQQAVDHITGRLHEVQRKFDSQSRDVLARYHGHELGGDVENYVAGLGYLISGNVWWTYQCARYNGPGFVWNGHREGLVTLSENATIVHPPNSSERQDA